MEDDDDDGDEDFEMPRPVKKKKKKADASSNGDTKEEKGKAGFFNFPDVNLPRDLTKEFQCERCSRGFTTLFSYRMHFHRHDMQVLLGSF